MTNEQFQAVVNKVNREDKEGELDTDYRLYKAIYAEGEAQGYSASEIEEQVIARRKIEKEAQAFHDKHGVWPRK